jgi:hypothetical protein
MLCMLRNKALDVFGWSKLLGFVMSIAIEVVVLLIFLAFKPNVL